MAAGNSRVQNPEAGLVEKRQEATSCQPWRGQPAARWNRRATRPNAIRVSVINDKVDPVSGVLNTPLLAPIGADGGDISPDRTLLPEQPQ